MWHIGKNFLVTYKVAFDVLRGEWPHAIPAVTHNKGRTFDQVRPFSLLSPRSTTGVLPEMLFRFAS